MKKRKGIRILIAVLVLWLLVIVVDFATVHSFQRPVFCVLTQGADDGGSGRYVGLGYSFEIKGRFMPEEEEPGVTSYAGKLFGVPMMAGVKD